MGYESNTICQKYADYGIEIYLITNTPGELVVCQKDRSKVIKKVQLYPKNHKDFYEEIENVHIPCPPFAFNANTNKRFLLDLKKHKILCGIKPEFLVHRFRNVISEEARAEIWKKWQNFLDEDPVCHNTDKDSSVRSSSVKSFHLGIWRRMELKAFVSRDTKCKDNIHASRRCRDFLQAVGDKVAGRIKQLMKNYAPEEWEVREK